MTTFDRTVYFDKVRALQFQGHMDQRQVDGQNFILSAWEKYRPHDDLRWLAYFLATTCHETASAMWPVEENGKGAGMEYGEPDPETGQAYYGRGDVQLTWADNYKRADTELGEAIAEDNPGSCYWHPELQLDAAIAARTGYAGMMQAWFRPPNDFGLYFNNETEDPYGAREIINGDKTIVPSWSNGVSIGKLVESYYDNFLEALQSSVQRPPAPPVAGEPVVVVQGPLVHITSKGEPVTVILDGEKLT